MSKYDWSTTASDNDDADSAINWVEGQPPSTVNNSARAMMAAEAKDIADTRKRITTGGSSNAYTATTSTQHGSYADGLTLYLSPNHANTGAATLNVDSLGAKPLRVIANTDMTADQIVIGRPFTARYNLSDDEFLIDNPAIANTGFIGVQVITSSGNYTANSDANQVVVEIIGGGGAGGGVAATPVAFAGASGGGTAGGYVLKHIAAATADGATVTIGAGGTGASAADGGDGGDSTWSDGTNTLTAGGGDGCVQGITTTGGATSNGVAFSGTVSGGDINLAGEAGGSADANGDGVDSTNDASGGNGGSTRYGAGGRGADVIGGATATELGATGSGYGSGGGGSVTIHGGAEVAGGDGAPGVCIIWEYA